MGNRKLVIGDVHGCWKTFKRLLDAIGLDRTDTLYLLGDLIDRGPDSRGVIETILQLQQGGFDIRPIRGNHEMMLILAATTGVFEDLILWLNNGGEATLSSYGVDHPKDIPGEHWEFLVGLPYYRTTSHYLFVHAGLDFSLDDPLSVAGRTAMLWTRDGGGDSKKIGGRTLVTGHTPQTLDAIRKNLTTKHILTDNGCYLGTEFTEGKGTLVAVNLDTREMIVQPNIDAADHGRH
jgi:serine/threonine protein phosphatase 1